VAGARFEELRELCAAAGDKASLAIGMAGLVMDHAHQDRMREASQLASEADGPHRVDRRSDLDGGAVLRVDLRQGESAEWCDALRWSQRVIDLADGDPSKGNFIIGSPLALAFTTRATARYCLGRPGWRDDLRHGLAMARSADPMSYAGVVTYVYSAAIPPGVLRPDDRAVREIEDALRIAERSGDDVAVAIARMTLGIALVHRPTAAERDRGQKLLAEVSEVFLRRGFFLASYLSSRSTWHVRGLGVEIAMTPYRSCAPPSTICSARDGCWGGAFLRQVFWWKHCSIAGPRVTWPKPRPRSSG
jgi:hypothetical protein